MGDQIFATRVFNREKQHETVAGTSGHSLHIFTTGGDAVHGAAARPTALAAGSKCSVQRRA